MPRTVDAAARATKAETFVEAAQRLIQSKGYERMSIQDVLDATDASRGAFYHYFDSKEALLAAVIERITDAALAAVAPLVADPAVRAPDKMRRVFVDIGSWKMERADLMRAIAESWMSPENTVVRERFRSCMNSRLGPLLAKIIAQGKDEGTFAVESPAATATVLVSLLSAASEAASLFLLARQAGRVTYPEVEATLLGYFTAFERILGMTPGSMAVVDRSVLRQWFG